MTIIIDHVLIQQLEKQQATDQATYTKILAGFALGQDARTLPLMGGQAVSMGASFPVNQGIGMGLQGPVTAAELDQFEDFFIHYGLSPTIELCPLVDGSLVELLGQRGYRLRRFYNSYVRPIAHDEILPGSPEIDVRLVDDANVEQWALAVTGDTSTTGEAVNNPLVTLAKATFSCPRTTCFLATIQGEVAGGGALSVSEGVGTFSFMRTRSEFRRRGVQHALLAARLAAASAHGCKIVTCSTNPGSQSQRNVQRLGFLLAYTKVFLVKPISC